MSGFVMFCYSVRSTPMVSTLELRRICIPELLDEDNARKTLCADRAVKESRAESDTVEITWRHRNQ